MCQAMRDHGTTSCEIDRNLKRDAAMDAEAKDMQRVLPAANDGLRPARAEQLAVMTIAFLT
jgi:hypothetical protein